MRNFMDKKDQQLHSSETASDSHNRERHFFALHIDKVEEVSRMIEPMCYISFVNRGIIHTNTKEGIYVRSFPSSPSLRI